jgi:Gamma-glutamyl cyclotransferase, AIG2-like
MRPSPAIARQPIDAAPMIPLAAAGRQPLFFFGTLMDTDILAYLLERPIDLDDLQPATITGFRRVRATGASYPVLLPAVGGEVEGMLLRRATTRDIARINHYERGEYSAQLHDVATADGRQVAAWLYLGLDGLLASDRPWSLADWQAHDKPAFYDACVHWMADFREPAHGGRGDLRAEGR